jgi:hypothetical protein
VGGPREHEGGCPLGPGVVVAVGGLAGCGRARGRQRVVRGPRPRRADAGRCVRRAGRGRPRVRRLGGRDALGAGAAQARCREQPPGGDQPGDDAPPGGARRPGLGRWFRGPGPRRGDAREPRVLRGGVRRGPGRAAAVRHGAGCRLRVRLVGGWLGRRPVAARCGDGAGPAVAGAARCARGGPVVGGRGRGAHRHPVPGAAHRSGDVLGAPRHAHARRWVARGDPRRGGRSGEGGPGIRSDGGVRGRVGER